MDNKVIYEDDYIIGSKENIWSSFKEEINRELQDNTVYLEVLKTNINDILEVMIELDNNNNIYNDTLVKIKECPMGGYTYTILEEVK